MSEPITRTAGRFGVAQLVALELAVVAAGAATVTDPPMSTVLAVTAGLFAIGALGRSEGRWLYEAVAARLRRRPRSVSPVDGFAGLVPELNVRSITDRGTAIGVGQDRLGWFAAVAIGGPEGRVALRMDWLAKLLADFTVPVTSLQVVVRQVPFSDPLDEQTHCSVSYRELLAGMPAPANREIWLAARLGASDAIHAASTRGGGLAGVDRAIKAVVARMGTALTGSELGYQVLDADDLRRGLLVSCGLFESAPVTESWSGWTAAGYVHIGFAVRAFPSKPEPGLLSKLADLPAAASVNTAVVLRPGRTPSAGPRIRVLLRVMAAPDRVGECVKQAQAAARRAGVRLRRLNGEHAAAVYATAPTGAPPGPATL